MKSSRNALLSANRAIASVRANPRIARRVSSSFSFGLRATATTSPAKTVPIPTPAPPSAIVASPAPISFAATVIVFDRDLGDLRSYDNTSIDGKSTSTACRAVWAAKGGKPLYLPEIGITTFHELERMWPLVLVWLEMEKCSPQVRADAASQRVACGNPYAYRLGFSYEQDAVE